MAGTNTSDRKKVAMGTVVIANDAIHRIAMESLSSLFFFVPKKELKP